jgi:hypothetical protein
MTVMPHGFEPLQAIDASGEKAEVARGPLKHASGPVKKDETLKWLLFWVIQNPPGERGVAAYGESPEGETFKDTWTIEAEMAGDKTDGDNVFTAGLPALGIAMALVVDSENNERVEWWGDAVMIVAGGEAPASYE